MEITNSKPKEQIIKESIDFLENNIFLSKAEKIQLAKLFCEYCLIDLGVNKINISVVDLVRTSGSTINDDISLSTKELKKLSQVEMFNTIAHEIRHVYQNSIPPKLKDFEHKFSISYPLQYIPSQITFVNYADDINMFDYYITSTVETDARKYANTILEEFLEAIQNNTNKKHHAYKWAKFNIKRHDKYKQKETKNFTRSFLAVRKTYSRLRLVTLSKFDNKLNIVESDNNKKNRAMLKNYISYILYVYCDDNLTNKLFNYCIKYKDKPSIVALFQHPNTNITIDMFKTYIKTFYKKDVKLDVLCQTFPNWNPNCLEAALKLVYPNNEKAQNSTPKITNKKIIHSDTLKKQIKLCKHNINDIELQK